MKLFDNIIIADEMVTECPVCCKGNRQTAGMLELTVWHVNVTLQSED